MKIFCINFRNFCAIAIISLVCIITLSATNVVNSLKTLEVFKSDKLLPIYSVDTPDKEVAITFDCAWGADDIDDILKILDENNAKATFFMVGQWAEKFPNSVKALCEKGHDIGNHTYTHAHLNSLEIDQIKQEITKANEVFKNITGKDCNLFRAPYGEYNDTVIKAGNELNQYTIQWSIDSLDWQGLSSEKITERILTKLHNGAIILLHNDTENTANALPGILKGIKEAGYEIVPTSELIYKGNFYMDHTGKQIQE